MKETLLKKYRTIYEQCFIPILVNDNFDTDIILQGCEMADIKVVEYTLRRKDVKNRISILSKDYPQIKFLIGSTIDSDKIINCMKYKFSQLMTIDEILSYEVEGIVSMLPFSKQTIQKYCNEYIMIPSAETLGEALLLINAGAQFIKLSGKNLSIVKHFYAEPTFNFCPSFVTGGVTIDCMQDVFKAGATIVATGFDVILKDVSPQKLTSEIVCERVIQYQKAALLSRKSVFPEISEINSLNDHQWVNRLPHWNPFSAGGEK